MVPALVRTALFAALASAFPLAVQQRDFTTRNDLLDGICKPITLIFARGTIEPGNVGYLVGPPLFDALGADISTDDFAVQGVDYPATIAGYLEGGDPGGAATLAQLTNQAVTQCPGTQVVLSGYSQGAQVVHLGANQLSSDVTNQVAAVVLFGDPFDNQPFNSISSDRVLTFCFSDDLICQDLPIVDPEHLAYALDAPAAASFIASKVSTTSAGSSPAPTPRAW